MRRMSRRPRLVRRYPAAMDVAEDADRAAVSLAGWLDRLTFADLVAGDVTERIIEAVVAWADSQGWRVHRRARSVLPLPPPMAPRQAVLDVGCARAAGPPLAAANDPAHR